jgi:hypothetical protein
MGSKKDLTPGMDAWYYDIDDDEWYSVFPCILLERLDNGKWKVKQQSWEGVEIDEEAPYEFEVEVAECCIYATELLAIEGAGDRFMEDLEQRTNMQLDEQEAAKKAWEENHAATFPYKKGDVLYVVVPYVASAPEVMKGTVQHTPLSAAPKCFAFQTDKTSLMVPTAYAARTKKDAIDKYLHATYKQLMFKELTE